MVNLDISRLLEWTIDFTHLFKQSSLLYYIRHGLHLHTFRFIDVLQRVQGFGMFMLNDSDLGFVSTQRLAVTPSYERMTHFSESPLSNTPQ